MLGFQSSEDSDDHQKIQFAIRDNKWQSFKNLVRYTYMDKFETPNWQYYNRECNI